MKVLLLGATGRTGKWVLEAAIAKGYEVHCLARNSQRIQPRKGLTIMEGHPENQAHLEEAVDGCHFIVSTLNVSRKSDFPWTPLRTPSTYLSDVMKQLIPIAEQRDVKRIAICSAWGVSETKKEIPGWFRWIIDNSNVGAAYRDHERQEQIVQSSKLDWTIVRPVGLTNSSRPETIRETFRNQPKPTLTISRKSVAQYLINSLEREDLIKKAVVISKG